MLLRTCHRYARRGRSAAWYNFKRFWPVQSVIRHFDKLIRKSVTLLIIILHPSIDGLIALRGDHERTARLRMRDMPVAHDKIPVLKDESSCAKHLRPIGKIIVHCNVGYRASAEMAAVGQAEQSCGRGASHGGDLV